MSYRSADYEIWTIQDGDWVSTKYIDNMDIIKRLRKRNLLFIGSVVFYLVISAALLLF